MSIELNSGTRILIVGLGLIGGSYADALTDKGYYVGAVEKRKEAIDYALDKGIIKSGITEAYPEYISDFDIIVFALYPKVFMEWIRENQHCIKKGALLTDVTGVKGSVVYEIQNILREDLEFIGAHPMAGREVYGVENSDKSIFKNANYIVTPTDKNTPEAIDTCCRLGRELGFKTVATLSPKKHDEMIGFLSQLTHCIAVSLMCCKDSEKLVDYTGDSFRDLTRIAKINDAMWSELFLMNKEELLCQMELFIKKFTELKDTVAREDTEAMREMMRLSTKRRKYFDK